MTTSEELDASIEASRAKLSRAAAESVAVAPGVENLDLDLADIQSVAELYLRHVMAHYEEHHFRTSHDTGANRNAMFVWNLLRPHAGLERLETIELERKHPAGAELSDHEEAFHQVTGQRMREARDFMPRMPDWPPAEEYPVDNAAYRKARIALYVAWLRVRDAVPNG